MWYIKRTPPWYVDRDVSIRNSLRSNYTIRVLVRPTLPAARGSSQLAAIAESLTGTKIKNFFIVV